MASSVPVFLSVGVKGSGIKFWRALCREYETPVQRRTWLQGEVMDYGYTLAAVDLFRLSFLEEGVADRHQIFSG